MTTENASLLFDAQLRTSTETADRRCPAVEFVTAVDAVVESVASHGTVDAMATAASELVRQTQALGLTNSRLFIRSVIAILVVVAHLRLRNAEEIAATEFTGRTAQVCAHLFGFVGTVAAVIVAVATPQERRAFAVGAGEIIRRTRGIAQEFIGAIRAVDIAVATPIGLDAELGIGALEFAFAAGRVAVGLVAPVVAVEFAVAAQRTADAAAVPAPEFRFAAVARCATFLVRSVAAIVIVIATPAPWNALVVVALDNRKKKKLHQDHGHSDWIYFFQK